MPQKKVNYADLSDRVNQYRSMRLPGQPMGVHMGTSYLIDDLFMTVQHYRDQLTALGNPDPDGMVEDGEPKAEAPAREPTAIYDETP